MTKIEILRTLSDIVPDVIKLIDAATKLVDVYCDRVNQGAVLHTEEIQLMRVLARLRGE